MVTVTPKNKQMEIHGPKSQWRLWPLSSSLLVMRILCVNISWDSFEGRQVEGKVLLTEEETNISHTHTPTHYTPTHTFHTHAHTLNTHTPTHYTHTPTRYTHAHTLHTHTETDRQRKRKRKTDRKDDRGDFFNGITHHSTVGPVSRVGMQHTDCHLQCFGAHALYCSILGLY